MGLPWCTCLIIAGVWCMPVYAYNVERIDDRNQHGSLNIEVISNVDNIKSLDLGSSESFEDMFHVPNIETTKTPGTTNTQNRMFLLFLTHDNYTGGDSDSTPLDSWSVVWYVASFGGLIIFFLIVSCSEWCCRRAIRNHQNCNRTAPTTTTPNVPDTPPPSYDQFAPPSYESICLGRARNGEKSKYDIYVVPVHTLGTLVDSRRTEDAPPSYLSASGVVLPNDLSRVT